MSINIGHASIDENGRANSGQAGDQTGKEVCVRTWYNASWNVVFRAKSATVAEKMAAACEILCNGNLVGYDQYQRNTLWDELAKVGWDPAKLKTKCETDCSAFMTALAKIAGIEVPRVSLGNGKYNAPVTQTMRQAFTSTGSFEALTDSKYCTSDNYIKRGDILVRESGHTAMALGNGSLSGASTISSTATGTTAATGATTAASTESVTEKTATGVAKRFDGSLAGTYRVTATSGLHIRNDSNLKDAAKSTSLAVLPYGTKVQNYGYFNPESDGKWLYVQVTYGGVKYTGFISAEWLSKQ